MNQNVIHVVKTKCIVSPLSEIYVTNNSSTIETAGNISNQQLNTLVESFLNIYDYHSMQIPI